MFVSSTFLDLATERRLLEREVFRPLVSLCAARNARFQAVDLRWGVSAEAARTQATMPTCLTEVERCRAVSPWLHFLLVLGERRGWLPVPASIDDADFAALIAGVPDSDRRMLLHWFDRDGNGLPTARWMLRERAPGRSGARAWEKTEAELQRLLADAAVLLPEDRRQPFQQSAVEQEVSAGVFAHPGSTVGARAVFLTEQAHLVEEAQRSQVADLKQRIRDHLPDDRVTEQARRAADEGEADYRDRFVAAVLPALQADVEAQLDIWERQDGTGLDVLPSGAPGPLPVATQQPLVGRHAELAALEDFLDGEDSGLLTVVGLAGTGKTALLAAAAAAARGRALDRGSDAVVVARLLGTTPATSGVRTLLPGLVHEIAAACGIESPVDQDAEYPDMIAALDSVLREAGRPVQLVLDAVDQLSTADAAADLTWLPDPVPPNVRIVLSVLRPEGAGGQVPTAAERRATRSLELAGLPTADAVVLLTDWLGDVGRTLTADQSDAVLAAFEREGRPLWLRLAVEDCRHWRSDHPATALPTSLDDLIRLLYRRLSAPAQRGSVLVDRVLGLLAASSGLSEDELLDALSADEDVMAEARHRSAPKWRDEVDRFPVVLWAQLAADLLPYLTERGDDASRLLDYYHRQLRAVALHWTGGPDAARLRHRELAALFGRRADPGGRGRWLSGARPLSQVALHLSDAGQGADLADLLVDFRYLERVCATVGRQVTEVHEQRSVRYGGASWLRERIGRAQQEGLVRPTDPAGPMLQALDRAIGREAGVLVDTPELFWQQVGNRLTRDPAALAAVAAESARRLDEPGPGWLSALLAPVEPPGLLHVLRAHDRAGFVAFGPDGSLLITGGRDGTVRLWDARTGNGLADLPGHSGRVWCGFAGPERLVTADRSGRVQLWRWDGIRVSSIATVQLDGEIRSLAAGPTVVVATGPHGVDLLPCGTLQPTVRLTEIGDATCCAGTPDGRIIVTGHLDGSVRSWTSSGAKHMVRRREQAHDGQVVCCAVDASGDTLLTGGQDTALRTWSADLERLGGDLADDDLPVRTGVNACCLSDDGSRAVVSLVPGLVQTWDLATRRPIATLVAHAAFVESVAISGDGQLAASAGLEGTVRIWEAAIPADAGTEPYISQAQALAIDRAGRQTTSVDSYGLVRTWWIGTPEEPQGRSLGIFETCSWFCRDAVVAPDGARVVVVDHGSGLEVWQSAPPPVCLVRIPFPEASTCALSNGVVMAGAPDVEVLHAWSATTGEPLWTTPAVGGNRVLVTDPVAPLVLSGGGSGVVLLIEVRTGAATTLQGGGERVVSAAVGDGHVVAGMASGQVLRWTLVKDDWLPQESVSPHKGLVTAVAVLPDGRAVSGDAGGVLTFWQAGDPQPATAEGHVGGVRDLAVGGGGRLLVSTGDDKHMRVWDPATGERLGVLPLAGGGQRVAIHPTDQLIAACDSGSSVHVVRPVGRRPLRPTSGNRRSVR